MFELRSLIRSRAGAVALLAYLITGSLALVLSDRHLTEWQQALQTGQQAQERSITQARGFMESGEAGPSDRPWVDLSQPMWQDRYAGTRIAREPGPLAGVAAGSIDPAPVVFHISRRADPLAVGGYRIENPELATGSVDLVFVLSMLTPLLIGVLGLEIGGREREDRIDRLVVVHAGAVRGWLLARTLAIVALASLAAGVLCLAAGLMGGASAGELGTLIAFTAVYTMLWGGLLLAVNVSARSVRAAAFAFGALWTVLCVLLPTVAAEVGLGSVQSDFALAETLEARAQRYSAYEQELEDVVSELYASHPELKQLPAAADAQLEPQVSRHAYDAFLAIALAERHAERLQQEQAAQALAERAAWLSPPIALTLALERLAGAGPEAASAYQAYLVEAVQQRVRWVVEQAWRKEPLSQAEFEELVASAPPPFRWQPTGLSGPSTQLVSGALLAWFFAALSLVRNEHRLGVHP